MNLFRRLGRAALLLAGLTLVCLSAPVHARPPLKSDSKVKITAEASQPNAEGRQLVVLNLTIEKGWHLYANPVGNKDYDAAQTSVVIKAGQPLRDVKIAYPAGKVQKEKEFGDYNIYEGTVTIRAQVQRTTGDTSPLDVSVALQACSNVCLLPATVKLSVK